MLEALGNKIGQVAAHVQHTIERATAPAEEAPDAEAAKDKRVASLHTQVADQEKALQGPRRELKQANLEHTRAALTAAITHPSPVDAAAEEAGPVGMVLDVAVRAATHMVENYAPVLPSAFEVLYRSVAKGRAAEMLKQLQANPTDPQAQQIAAESEDRERVAA